MGPSVDSNMSRNREADRPGVVAETAVECWFSAACLIWWEVDFDAA